MQQGYPVISWVSMKAKLRRAHRALLQAKSRFARRFSCDQSPFNLGLPGLLIGQMTAMLEG